MKFQAFLSATPPQRGNSLTLSIVYLITLELINQEIKECVLGQDLLYLLEKMNLLNLPRLFHLL